MATQSKSLLARHWAQAVTGVVALVAIDTALMAQEPLQSENKAKVSSRKPKPDEMQVHNMAAVITDNYPPSCGDEDLKNKSDLCAQWYAARAAGEAAYWAKWTFWLGSLSLLLSGGGLVALLRTIAQGQKALKRAKTANKIARRTADLQLRPYLYVSDEIIKIWRTQFDQAVVSDIASAEIHFKNFGQTPARNVRVFARAFLADYLISKELPKLFSEDDCAVYSDTPEGKVHWFDTLEVSGILAATEDLLAGNKAIYIDGRIEYSGLAGAMHWTDFRYMCTGKSFAASRMVMAWDGNGSDYDGSTIAS